MSALSNPDVAALTDRELSVEYENACRLEALLYERGEPTGVVDGTVDMLRAEVLRRGVWRMYGAALANSAVHFKHRREA